MLIFLFYIEKEKIRTSIRKSNTKQKSKIKSFGNNNYNDGHFIKIIIERLLHTFFY